MTTEELNNAKEQLKETLIKLREDKMKESAKGGLRNDPIRALAVRVNELETRIATIEQRLSQLGIDVLLN